MSSGFFLFHFTLHFVHCLHSFSRTRLYFLYLRNSCTRLCYRSIKILRHCLHSSYIRNMIAVLLSLFSSLLLSTTAQTQVLPQAPTHSQPSTPQAIPPTIPLLWAASPFQADPRSTINSTISCTSRPSFPSSFHHSSPPPTP